MQSTVLVEQTSAPWKRKEFEGKPLPAPQTDFVKKKPRISMKYRNDETQTVVYLKLADLAITQNECDPILRANLSNCS